MERQITSKRVYRGSLEWAHSLKERDSDLGFSDVIRRGEAGVGWVGGGQCEQFSTSSFYSTSISAESTSTGPSSLTAITSKTAQNGRTKKFLYLNASQLIF